MSRPFPSFSERATPFCPVGIKGDLCGKTCAIFSSPTTFQEISLYLCMMHLKRIFPSFKSAQRASSTLFVFPFAVFKRRVFSLLRVHLFAAVRNFRSMGMRTFSLLTLRKSATRLTRLSPKIAQPPPPEADAITDNFHTAWTALPPTDVSP